MSDAPPTHAENEAKLVTRRISDECDQFHASNEYCDNDSCQCWCHE